MFVSEKEVFNRHNLGGTADISVLVFRMEFFYGKNIGIGGVLLCYERNISLSIIV